MAKTMRNITVRDFNRTVVSKITTDESFERPSGCWTSKNENGYIQDIFNRFNATPIVLADVHRCNSIAHQEQDKVSIAYFSSYVTAGYEYVSLDGKHRTKCIWDFVSNRITFSGYARDHDGNTIKVNNMYFKDLPSDIRDCFLNSEVTLAIFEAVKSKDLSIIFKGLNSGSPLSAQHLRNAIQTPMAAWTRDLVKTNMYLVETLFNHKERSQMKPHELATKVYLHSKDINTQCHMRSVLDRLYEQGENKSWNEVYDNDAKELAEDIFANFNRICKTVNPQGKVPYIAIVFSLNSVIVNKNYYISDDKKFYENVGALDRRLIKESLAQHGKDEENNTEEGVEINKSVYYYEQARRNWSIDRAKRQKILTKEIFKIPGAFGLSLKEIEKTA
jgi:hypothetical protein